MIMWSVYCFPVFIRIVYPKIKKFGVLTPEPTLSSFTMFIMLVLLHKKYNIIRLIKHPFCIGVMFVKSPKNIAFFLSNFIQRSHKLRNVFSKKMY